MGLLSIFENTFILKFDNTYAKKNHHKNDVIGSFKIKNTSNNAYNF